MEKFDDYLDFILDENYASIPANEIELPEALPKSNVVDKYVGETLSEFKTETEQNPLGTAYALPKGAAEAAVGSVGDLISIARGVIDIFSRPENMSKWEAFLQGLDKPTLLPTTEDVRSVTEKVLPTPENKATQSIGEFVSPVPVVVKAAKETKKLGNVLRKAKSK